MYILLLTILTWNKALICEQTTFFLAATCVKLWLLCQLTCVLFSQTWSLLKNRTRNEPEQISSTSGCKKRCFLFPHSSMQRDPGAWGDLSTAWTSSISGECCWYHCGWPQLTQTTAILVLISLCQLEGSKGDAYEKVTRKMSLPRKMCGQLLYCASKFLPGNSIPQFSAKVIFWSYPLICPSLKMTYSCCYVSVWDKSQPPKQTYHGMKEEERVFRNSVGEKQIKRDREKEKKKSAFKILENVLVFI